MTQTNNLEKKSVTAKFVKNLESEERSCEEIDLQEGCSYKPPHQMPKNHLKCYHPC